MKHLKSRLRKALAAAGFAALVSSAPLIAAEDLLLSDQFGEVKVDLFIPAEARPVRGILVHVFNYEMKTHDRNATFCREMGWAHVNTVISRKANNRPKKIREAMNEALVKFAAKTGLAELAHAPRAGTGFSAGGMCVEVLREQPELMIGNAISCSWVSDPEKLGPEAAAIPELYIIGAKPDGFKMLPAIDKFYKPSVAAGNPWMLGLQHGCGHDWANSGTLSMPWLKTIAEMRIPADADPSKPISLQPISFESGWRGDLSTIDSTWPTVVPAADYKGKPEDMVWLPDEAIARLWRAWQVKDSPVDLGLRTAAGANKLPAFQPKKSFGASLSPGEDLVLSIKPKDGAKIEIQSVRYFTGTKLIGEAEAAPWEIPWTGLAVGCHPVWAEYTAGGTEAATNPALICIEPGGTD